MYQGIWPTEHFNIGDAFLVSLVAIILVFLVLTLIILVTHGVTFGVNKVESKIEIKPRQENELLNQDPDAIIASLVATMEFNKETGKNAKLISIDKIDEKGE